MSQNGRTQARLERQRLEQLRLRHVRETARSQLAVCQAIVQSARDPAVQQLATGHLKPLLAELGKVAPQIEGAPDESLRTIQGIHGRLLQVLSDAEKAARRWGEEQARSQARIAQVRSLADAARPEADARTLEQVGARIAEADAHHRAGRYQQAVAVLRNSEEDIDRAKQTRFDETVRREVVRGILATLGDMGFISDVPRLDSAASGAGVVKLTGRMPSGRTASFEVNLDGSVNFDFGGYQERTCAKDFAFIGQKLRDQFGVRLAQPQVVWKNPEKIAKGALNLPSGTARGGIRG